MARFALICATQSLGDVKLLKLISFNDLKPADSIFPNVLGKTPDGDSSAN